MQSYNQPWTMVNKCGMEEPRSAYEYLANEQQQQQPRGHFTQEPECGKWQRPQYYQCGATDFSTNNKWTGSRAQAQCQESWQMPKQLNSEWEQVCHKMEKLGAHCGEQQQQQQWAMCRGNQQCCDEEMIGLVKELINILIGAEQSYMQLGFLCMDEQFTLTNTAEFLRLCGLRMRWLANGLIKRSVRLFNVTEWINHAHFDNWFRVPTKEELAGANNYTGIVKGLFKISMECEQRLMEKMQRLGEKLVKVDWQNAECGRFQGCKWFVNFVLPYQMHFQQLIKCHVQSVDMCDNGYVFDKCEMRPLVQKMEQLIHHLVHSNNYSATACPKYEATAVILANTTHKF